MQTGVISKLVQDREYGKIRTESGEDAHFHKNCLWNVEFEELTEGQEVEFVTQRTYKGFLAFQIRPYNKIPSLKD